MTGEVDAWKPITTAVWLIPALRAELGNSHNLFVLELGLYTRGEKKDVTFNLN